MDPERLKTWQPIIRDFLVVGVAVFMLVFGTTRISEPGVLTIVIGGALTLLGVPAALRADRQIRKNGNGNGSQGVDDERWSHLP